MLTTDCHTSPHRGTTYSPVKLAGTVLVIAKARLMRDLVGRVLSDGGYLVLGEDEHSDEPTFGRPPSDPAWKADFVIVIYEGDEISRDTLDKVHHAASGKVVLLLRESRTEDVSKEVLVAVDGVLNYQVSAEALLNALSLIKGGERVISRHLAHVFAKQTTTVDIAPRDAVLLSPREKEIILRLVHGESNKVIGHGLHITEATVKVHLKAILRKISVQNRTQVAIWAVNNGFNQNVN